MGNASSKARRAAASAQVEEEEDTSSPPAPVTPLAGPAPTTSNAEARVPPLSTSSASTSLQTPLPTSSSTKQPLTPMQKNDDDDDDEDEEEEDATPRPYAIDLEDVREAASRIADHITHTPVMRCRNLERLAGGRKLYLKAEMFQTSGAFKMRGALNAVLSLPAVEADAGVVTHSSGNHGAALAKAAAVRGVRATVVMPEGTPAVKVSAAKSYGAEIVACPRSGGMKAREDAARRIIAETGATLVPPYDHPAVMAGQGTVALELLSAVPQLDAIVVPISGGGLISGVAVAAKALTKNRIRIIGAEPCGRDGKGADAAACKAAGDLSVSRTMQAPETVADGLRGKLGELTWPVVRDLVDAIVVVSEEEIVDATRLVMERVKVVVEPSGAAALAAVLSPAFAEAVDGGGGGGGGGGATTATASNKVERVGVILSGGNVDLEPLFEAMLKGSGKKRK